MWELISVNKRNSVILMMTMAICLLLLGAAIGQSLGDPLIGVAVAAFIWIVLSFVSYYSGDQILLSSSGALPVTREVHPQLFNVVDEMTIAAGLGKMPAIYIIPDPAPNAFATGRKPETASIAVTAGLLSRLNRDELQGVIAHEMSHIIHRDILYVTLAGVMLGAVAILSDVYLRGFLRGSSFGRRTSGRGGGQAQAAVLLIAVLLAVLAPILTQVLYFALSRSREYLADAGSARLTRYPEGLASALEKIAAAPTQLAGVNRATAPMYIVNPLTQAGGSESFSLFSTHPPVAKRVAVLRAMMHGANWKDYGDAYMAVTKQRLDIPPSILKAPVLVPIRPASIGGDTSMDGKQHIRQTADLVRKVNGFTFLTCSCGLSIKVPPTFTDQKVTCPRCGLIHNPVPA
jgi:heat shock protein HtpX